MTRSQQIAQVAPLTRTGARVALLDYLIPETADMHAGQFVRIPFRKSSITGVIWDVIKQSDISVSKLRSVESVLSEQWTEEQQQLAHWLAEQTLTAPNIVARMALPTTLPKKQKRAVRKSSIVHGITWHTLDERQKTIQSLVDRLKAETAPTLILVPTQAHAESWYALLPKEKTSFVTGAVQSAGYRKSVAKLNQSQYILSTQSGLLAPLPQLERVIIDVADDEGYLSFAQSPRVDIRLLAVECARIHNARLTFLTRWRSPVIEQLAQGTKWTSFPEKSPYVLIQRDQEPGTERRKPIAESLVAQLEQTRTLWLASRRGEAGRLVCEDCSTAVLCPRCGLPAQVVQQKEKLTLTCVRDHLHFVVPAKCSHCSGEQFTNRQLGIEAQARYIQSMFPGQVIAQVDQKGVQGDLQKAQHIIATTAITSYLDFRCDAAVILQTDAHLFNGQYRAEEEFLTFLCSVRQMLRPRGTIYLQTFKPDQPVFSGLQNMDAYSQKILEQREELQYPPLGCLVLCIPQAQEHKNDTPFQGAIVKGVIETHSDGNYIYRTTYKNTQALLAYVRTALQPDWYATVNPPRLP